MQNENAWRPIIAVLANPETRGVAAGLMLGSPLEREIAHLSPSRRRHVTDALVQSGIIDGESGAFIPEVFGRILTAAAVPRRRGVERFLDGEQIRQYPASLDERGELLAWVAARAFADDEVLTEREVNERLSPYSEDVAVLRRYLVDYELVERRADGTEYARTVAEP